MDIPVPQEQQSLNPKDYRDIVIVAGSRGFSDVRKFHAGLMSYLDRFEGDILFVSGSAKSGGDDLIIRWCKFFKYPCLIMPAEWEYTNAQGEVVKNRAAGFERNAKMATVGNHLLAYYDGQSPGTTHMIDTAMKRGLSVKVIYLNALPEVSQA